MVSIEGGDGGQNQQKWNNYAAGCAIVASIISIIFGYDTGVMSGAMIFLKDELKINDAKVEVLAGILNICAMFGSLLAGRTSDYIGRRSTICVASIIFMLGSILMGYAPNYGVLMAGRCIAGIGVGFALMVAPVYIAEVSSSSFRGLLTCLPELGISIGVLLGYVSNVLFAKLSLKLGWRMMLGVAAIPSLALAFGIQKMPESPRWLVIQGRLGEAKKILRRVSNSEEEAEIRFRDIKVAAGIDVNCNDDFVITDPLKKTHGEGVWKELILRPTPAVRWMIIAAVGIHFFEHAVGIEAVILYSPRIFKKAGIVDKEKLLLASVGVGITKFTFVFISIFLLDRVGRRRLLLVSTTCIIAALAVLGACLTIVDHHHGRQLVWALSLGIISTYTFVAFFNVGLAPVSWVYSSEIFPLKFRAQGHSIGVAVNRLTNAIISMSFLSLYEAITIGGVFFLFSGISVLAWFFFYFLFPETKGRSLEDIEELFSKGIRSSAEGVAMQTGGL